MWLWEGKLAAESGETIDDVCREAIRIARTYARPGSVHQYLDFEFNGFPTWVYAHSTVTQIVGDYLKHLAKGANDAEPRHRNS